LLEQETNKNPGKPGFLLFDLMQHSGKIFFKPKNKYCMKKLLIVFGKSSSRVADLTCELKKLSAADKSSLATIKPTKESLVPDKFVSHQTDVVLYFGVSSHMIPVYNRLIQGRVGYKPNCIAYDVEGPISPNDALNVVSVPGIVAAINELCSIAVV
jgi:hypothetical protein